nr:MAG: hypothetical protein [Bacteriophage sp.]
MLRLKDILIISNQFTNDTFDLYVDGILRKQKCKREDFNNYMLNYNCTEIVDVAESIYYNKAYVFTDSKNMRVDEYVNEVCIMNKPVTDIEEIIFKVCRVLELNITNQYFLDYKGTSIGYYSIKENKVYFYNHGRELITIVTESDNEEIMLIQISSALTNLYNLESGSIS